MGVAQSIPIASEVVTIVDAGSRSITAGTSCDVVDNQHQDAGMSKKHYADVNLIVANTQVVFTKIDSESKEHLVDYLLGQEGKAWAELGEDTRAPGPGVGNGQVLGLVRYASGAESDTAGGETGTIKVAATRTPVVLGETAVAGGTINGLLTAATVLGRYHSTPVGKLADVTQAVNRTGSPSDWITALEIPSANPDEATEALQGAFKIKARAGEPNLTATAAETAGRPTPMLYKSLVDCYTPFHEVADAQPQTSLADLKSLPATHDIVKTYANTADALRDIEAGGKYIFILLPDRSYRVVEHADASRAAGLHPNKGVMGQASLVDPGTEIIAAGEIHVDEKGVITNMTCKSGRFRVPLEVMAEQIGRDFSHAVLTFESPTFTKVFTNMVGGGEPNSTLFPLLRKIAIYSTALLVITTTSDPKTVTFHNARYIVTFRELAGDCIRMIGFGDEVAARMTYGEVSDSWAKVLMDKSNSDILLSSGEADYVNQCKEEVLKFRTFVVTHGRHLSPLPDRSPYVVAFHKNDCVKMVGCPNPQIADQVYINVSLEWAKILVNRRELMVSHFHGDSWHITQCKEEVLRLPAFDDTAPLLLSPYIVAFRLNDRVRMIGFQTAGSAQETYDTISRNDPKALYDMERSMMLASYGIDYHVEEKILQVTNFSTTAGLQHAPYIIAMHQNDRVRMIGFSAEGAARAIYSAVSDQWARVLVDRRRAQVLLSYGDNLFVKICKEEVLHMPLFEDSFASVHYGPYIVAFHHNNHVKMVGVSTQEAARAVFDAISSNCAKVILDVRRPGRLAAHGDRVYIYQCEVEIGELHELQSTTPLHIAPFIVAYHQRNRVRMFGFSQLQDAQAMYDAVSDLWAKVLMNRWNSESSDFLYALKKPLKSHGDAYHPRLCKQEVLRLSVLDDTAPLRNAPYLFSFYRDNQVMIIGFSELEPARGICDALSDDLTSAKVLLDVKRFETLLVSGSNDAVLKCEEELTTRMRPNCNQPDEIIPLKNAPYVVAIYLDHIETIRMLGFSEEGHAAALSLYDSVSAFGVKAKVLMNKKQSEVLKSYGNLILSTECKRAILRI